MILVTGASGSIGRALVNHLLGQGEAVRAHARQEAALERALAFLAGSRTKALSTVSLDLTTADAGQLSALCQGCSTVVHCAALVHKPQSKSAEYALANRQVTSALAQAAKANGSECFLFLSTASVYGEGPFSCIKESSKGAPQSAYAQSKFECELDLAQLMPAPRTIILRPGLVFGRGDRGNMQALIKQISNRLYFHIGGNTAEKSVIFSDDLARAIALCAAKLSPGCHVLNVANPEPITVVELADTIARACQRPPPPTVPLWLVQSAARAGHLVFGAKAPLTLDKVRKLMTTTTLDVSELVRTTGFSPQASTAEALKLEIDWLATVD